MKTFSEKVVELACSIPSGRITTYGRIARAAGGGGMAAQSITSILGRAEAAGTDIPWHRIVYADGKIWVDAKRRSERLKLYKQEGIELDDKDRVKNFNNLLVDFR